MIPNNKHITFGLLLAHFLLWTSFFWQPFSFWILFPISLFLLSLYSVLNERILLGGNFFQTFWLGILSGIVIYLLFAFGKWIIVLTELPLLQQLQELFTIVQPIHLWHYLVVFLIIIPAEELFWRGFLVRRLNRRFSEMTAIIFGAFLYASAHIYAGALLLVLAALLAGIVWGWIYMKTRNIWTAILSHLIFDLLLLVLLPLM